VRESHPSNRWEQRREEKRKGEPHPKKEENQAKDSIKNSVLGGEYSKGGEAIKALGGGDVLMSKEESTASFFEKTGDLDV